MTLTRKTDVLRENPVPVPNITSTGPGWKRDSAVTARQLTGEAWRGHLFCRHFSNHEDYIERFGSCLPVGRDSSVGMALATGSTVRGSNPGEAKFSAILRTAPGAHPASCTIGTGVFPGIKRPGRDVEHPAPSSAEVKGRVQVYLYSPGPSWSVQVCTLPLLPVSHWSEWASITKTRV
jgi:hypothetical protein